MSDGSKIEWTDATWTPIRTMSRANGKIGWHCEHKSEGCRNCYAETMNIRLGTGLDFKPGHRKDLDIFLDEKMLRAPLKWRKPRKVFVCSMTDLFADFVPDTFIDRMFAVMALCPQHTFQILTKRPERMRRYMLSREGLIWCAEVDHPSAALIELLDQSNLLPLPNVWLGVSCEDQATADARIPHLLATPAATRFLSCEPLLGAIRLDGFLRSKPHDAVVDWIIVGGESGRGARPMHPDWARSLRDQCAAAGVAFFMKQMAKKAPIPEHLLVREFPNARR